MKSPKAARALAESLSQKSGSSPIAYRGAVPFGSRDVHAFELDNGLRVLLLVDDQAPVVTYNTWFRVGSRHEVAGKTGLAHLFEHLMFNETKRLAAGEFDKKLEACGAETNAATWLDWTYYYESVPSDALGTVIRLEAERMGELVLRHDLVESEKEVVANERRFRVDDDVDGLASERLWATAFEKHAYHAPTIGWMQDIEAFNVKDCEAFYRTYYAPNNATVVIVGSFSPRSVLKKIRAYYGHLPAATIPPEDIQPEPPQTSPRRLELTLPAATDKLLVGYHGPALGDADHVPMTVLCEILFGGRASRMHKAFYIDNEIASDVRGWVSTFRDPGLFELGYTARGGIEAERLEQLQDEVLAAVTRELVSDDELSRAKSRLELHEIEAIESNQGKAEQIGFYDTVLGDATEVFRRIEATRRVRPEDIRRVARRYLRDDAKTVVLVRPRSMERAA